MKQMNERRVYLIGIENKVNTVNYNVFLKYVINNTQNPVLLTFILPRSRRERYGSTLLPATREQHDQNCTQSH